MCRCSFHSVGFLHCRQISVFDVISIKPSALPSPAVRCQARSFPRYGRSRTTTARKILVCGSFCLSRRSHSPPHRETILTGNTPTSFITPTPPVQLFLDSGCRNQSREYFPSVSDLTRISETLPCDRFIPRVRELESQGALYWSVRVLPNNSGYEVRCSVPTKTEVSQSDRDRQTSLGL